MTFVQQTAVLYPSFNELRRRINNQYTYETLGLFPLSSMFIDSPNNGGDINRFILTGHLTIMWRRHHIFRPCRVGLLPDYASWGDAATAAGIVVAQITAVVDKTNTATAVSIRGTQPEGLPTERNFLQRLPHINYLFRLLYRALSDLRQFCIIYFKCAICCPIYLTRLLLISFLRYINDAAVSTFSAERSACA